MGKLEDIVRAVEALSPQDQTRFRKWYAELDARLFDDKIERGAKSGKLDKLAAKARAAHKAGLTRDL